MRSLYYFFVREVGRILKEDGRVGVWLGARGMACVGEPGLERGGLSRCVYFVRCGSCVVEVCSGVEFCACEI